MLWPALALLLEMTRADFGRRLRVDALNLGLRVLLVATGLAAAAVCARSPRDGIQRCPVSASSPIYGIRLLARADTFPLFFTEGPVFWRSASRRASPPLSSRLRRTLEPEEPGSDVPKNDTHFRVHEMLTS